MGSVPVPVTPVPRDTRDTRDIESLSDEAQLSTALAPQVSPSPRTRMRTRILNALESTDWNRAEAAKMLGMSRATIYRKIRKYEIGDLE